MCIKTLSPGTVPRTVLCEPLKALQLQRRGGTLLDRPTRSVEQQRWAPCNFSHRASQSWRRCKQLHERWVVAQQPRRIQHQRRKQQLLLLLLL